MPSPLSLWPLRGGSESPRQTCSRETARAGTAIASVLSRRAHHANACFGRRFEVTISTRLYCGGQLPPGRRPWAREPIEGGGVFGERFRGTSRTPSSSTGPFGAPSDVFSP